MANDIITHRDALRHTARRTAVSVGLTVLLTFSLCLLQFGHDPDALVRAGLVTKSSIMISMIISGLLTASLSYRSALMMRELALTRAELQRISCTDQLTGLLNRRGFDEAAISALVRSREANLDVEASRAIRQAEVGAAKTMIERTEERFGLKPERLVGDTAYGAAPMLNWLVEEKGIAPHIPVFDKSKRDDGTFSRSDFRYDPTGDVYHCPGGKRLGTSGTVQEGKTLLYRASKLDCDVCLLKPQCCPKEPSRKIPRDIHEHARDIARSIAGTEGFEFSRHQRKKIEMNFAHLKRILKLGRLRLRGPLGAQDEFVLAAIAQNLRRFASLVARPPPAQALRSA